MMSNFDDLMHIPLVSVVVVSYNSVCTIEETLDSIKAQTYKNLELIVSDDCSSDRKTIEVIQKWLDANGSRFVHAELVTADKNTGVSGNVNRGVAKSHGEWIKSVAGDDLLIPTAIEEYICFITNHLERVRMCVCDVEPFSVQGEVPESRKQEYQRYFEYEKAPYGQQLLQCMESNIFFGPCYFYSKELFDEIGGFTSEYGNGEEWPFVYKVLKGGNQIYVLEKKLVRYRFSLDSLSHNRGESGMRNKNLELSTCRFFFDMPFKDLLREHRYLIAWDRFLYYGTLKLYCEHEGVYWSRFLMRFSRYFSPYAYWKRIKTIIHKVNIKI